MELIKHFETYIAAQKATGMQFVFFGAAMLIAGVLLHFTSLNPITQGLRNGFLILSLLLLVSGIGFVMNQNKLLKTKTETFQQDPLEFKQQEAERMEDVSKSVPKIIFGLSTVLILLILAVLFLIHPPFWKGIAFSVLIYLLGLLILESISFLSVKTYLENILQS